MEVEMEDDNSNSNAVDEVTFTTAVEIDIDYEFQAARFFDFTREESTAEARGAEMWFDSAESYPPSLRLHPREEIEKVNRFPESKGLDNRNQLVSISGVGQTQEDSAMVLINKDGDLMNRGVPLDLKSCYIQEFKNQHPTSTVPTGLTFKDSGRNDGYRSQKKSSWKPSFPRSSTLMKSTASQLAKQNQQPINHSRFQKLENNNSFGVESQAAKRQKLEGGHLCKDTDAKQQANLVHKTSKREGIVNGNAGHGKLRITIPRPPELATAQRARRISLRPKADSGHEHVVSITPGFRALPLNRKIFEEPLLLHQNRSSHHLTEFQEFHLKTSERAMQNTTAVPSTSACYHDFKALQKPSFSFVAQGSNKESKRSHAANGTKQEKYDTMHRFTALPLNKKILSSKGDLGVFRNNKREATVPMAFNFQTEKRAQPPTDLFNKLSLASELQQDSGSQLNLPRPPSIFAKSSKENRVCSFQPQNEIKQLPIEKLPKMGPKQVHIDSDRPSTFNANAPLSSIRRSLGIR